MADLIPIINQPNLYAEGFIANTTTTPGILVIDPGRCRDSTNTFDIVSNTTLTLNGNVSGANGLDIGSFANNSFYYLYVVSDPTNTLPPAAVISLSPTGPVMPSVKGITYGAFRLIDYVPTLTIPTPLAFYPFKNCGLGRARHKEYTFRATTSGTTPLITTNTAFTFAFSVPKINYGDVNFTAEFIPSLAGNYVDFNLGNTLVQSMYRYYGLVNGATHSFLFNMTPTPGVSNIPTIYGVSGNTGNTVVMYVSGYNYYI